MLKSAAPVEGCFEAVTFKDRDFHGHGVIGS